MKKNKLGRLANVAIRTLHASGLSDLSDEEIKRLPPIDRNLRYFTIPTIALAIGVTLLGLTYNVIRQVQRGHSTQRASNTVRYDSHMGYDVYTDVDYDGSLDVREQVINGPNGFRKIYCKAGYGPSGSIDGEVEIVKPDYFDNENAIFQKDLIARAYGQ